MKRFIGLLLCMSLCTVALAQGPPFRFWQREERVNEVARNLAVISYEVGWDVPRPTNPEFPKVWSHLGVRYRWQNKDGSLTPEYFQTLRSQTWAGKPVVSVKINRNFSASDDLKHTMPRTAISCLYQIEIESGIDTPGFSDRRFWRSSQLWQSR